MNKQLLEQLMTVSSESDGTSLITMYIPSEYNLWLATEFLTKEKSTVMNIKDKNVRKDATTALKSAMYQIKAYAKPKAPKNGLVLIAGIIRDSNSYL